MIKIIFPGDTDREVLLCQIIGEVVLFTEFPTEERHIIYEFWEGCKFEEGRHKSSHSFGLWGMPKYNYITCAGVRSFLYRLSVYPQIHKEIRDRAVEQIMRMK